MPFFLDATVSNKVVPIQLGVSPSDPASASQISHALSDFNVTHSAVANATWQLPVAQSLNAPAKAVFGGWPAGSDDAAQANPARAEGNLVKRFAEPRLLSLAEK